MFWTHIIYGKRDIHRRGAAALQLPSSEEEEQPAVQVAMRGCGGRPERTARPSAGRRLSRR